MELTFESVKTMSEYDIFNFMKPTIESIYKLYCKK